MRVLAIDTALGACSAAVLDTELGGIIASESLPMLRGHAEALIPLLDRLTEAMGTPLHHIDRIVVTTGPGSFTGLRVGIAAARGIALAANKPAVGVSTLLAYAAPHLADDETAPVVAAIDARHGHVYLQTFAPGGRTAIAPKLAPLSEAVRAAAEAPARIVGNAAQAVADGLAAIGSLPLVIDARAAPDIAWIATTGAALAADQAPPKPLYLRAADAQPQTRRATAAPMIGLISRLLGRATPALSEARPSDAATIAELHKTSFQRGWSEDEVYGLLIEKNVVAHRATIGQTMAGFILSRLAAGEAEILSIAIAPKYRGRGLARPLLDLICGGLPGSVRVLCFSRSTNIMRRPVRCIAAPDSPTWDSAKAIIKAAPRRWCCAAIYKRAAREDGP